MEGTGTPGSPGKLNLLCLRSYLKELKYHKYHLEADGLLPVSITFLANSWSFFAKVYCIYMFII